MKMKSLEEISHNAFYKMKDYHQLTIDLIEETEDLFNDIYEDEEVSDESGILQSRLGTLQYKIYNIIEIFNPVFINEFNDLNCLSILVEEKIKELKQ